MQTFVDIRWHRLAYTNVCRWTTYIHTYTSIYKCRRPRGPRTAISAPPAELSGAKMFQRTFWIAFLFYQHFQVQQKSFLGAIEAESWLPLEPQSCDFAREGSKKSRISLLLFLMASEFDFSLILASLGASHEAQNRSFSASLFWSDFQSILCMIHSI